MPSLADITLDPAALGARIDFAAIFGNDRPVELEIGCGKGGFLLRQAKAHPERNYLGIEWANQFYKFAADRMARWGMTHVRVMRTDAKEFVLRHVPPGSLRAIHIYHPDPWPKKRHRKRRLITPDFALAAARALAADGRLAVQTDHAEYFQQIETVLRGCPLLAAAPFDDPEFGTIGERTETNYEIKYLRAGREIHRMAMRRVP